LRLRRAAGRDQANRRSVLDRMDKQWTDEQRESGADFIITSNEEQALLPRVLEVHQYMLNLSITNHEN